jgi:hypothetical protein
VGNELITLSAFEQALVEAKTIPEVKNLADQAELFRQYLRKQKAGREAVNAGAEMMLRAERRLGEMLKDAGFGEHGGDRKSSDKLSLENYGIKDRDDVKIWIIDNQLARRNLVPAARIELAIKKNDIKYQKDARERIKEHGNTAPGRNSTLRQTFAEVLPDDRRVDTQIGKALIVPLLRNMIQFEGKLDLKDELSLEGLSVKAIGMGKGLGTKV